MLGKRIGASAFGCRRVGVASPERGAAAFCERAAPDAPETIDEQRRCTGCRYRTIYGGSRGSASLPAPGKWLGPITSTVQTNDSIRNKGLRAVSVLERFLDRSEFLNFEKVF